jgi:hypothetical protein
MASFIEEYHPYTWPRILLGQTLSSLTVTTKQGEWVAVCWMTPVASSAARVGEFHLCAKPKYHGRWVTKHVLEVGRSWLSEWDYVLAVHDDPVFKGVLKRLGFDTSAQHMNILEREHGIP